MTTQDASELCPQTPESRSQHGVNQCAALLAHRAEEAMADTLREIERRRAREPRLLEAIRQSQARWLAFQEGELVALFPETDKQTAYGSMYNACRAQQRQRLAEQRTRELRLWLDGDPDAQGCSGAVSAPAPSIAQ